MYRNINNKDRLIFFSYVILNNSTLIDMIKDLKLLCDIIYCS